MQSAKCRINQTDKLETRGVSSDFAIVIATVVVYTPRPEGHR